MADKSICRTQTASQTAGPYLHIGLVPGSAGLEKQSPDLGADIVGPNAVGDRIRIEGTVIDGTGALAKEALIEIWQANSAGHYAHPDGGGPVENGFRGWGRAATDFEPGLWRFETIKPGATPGPDGGLQAPHLNLWVVARGINIGLNTRLYFADEAEANATDPVLALVDDPDRRKTLIATRHEDNGGAIYKFDIVLQGPEETVFFDI